MTGLPLGGSLPALVTPLTRDGDVDEGDLDVLVRRAVGDGASGVLVAGSTGEGTLLEPAQREQLVRRARAVVDGLDPDPARALVLAGASGPTVAALDADVARLGAAGADAVLVLAPHTYPLLPEELVDLHLGVAERAGVPTLVYHIPQLTGSALTPEALAQLAVHPNIVGVKDSSPDAELRHRFLGALRDTAGFALFTGHAPSLRAALEGGAAGSITAIANVRQREVVALHRAVADGDEAAEALQQRLRVLSERLADVGSSTPAALKAVLQLEGVLTERWCRPPLRSVPPAQLDRVRTAMLS